MFVNPRANREQRAIRHLISIMRWFLSPSLVWMDGIFERELKPRELIVFVCRLADYDWDAGASAAHVTTVVLLHSLCSLCFSQTQTSSCVSIEMCVRYEYKDYLIMLTCSPLHSFPLSLALSSSNDVSSLPPSKLIRLTNVGVIIIIWTMRSSLIVFVVVFDESLARISICLCVVCVVCKCLCVCVEILLTWIKSHDETSAKLRFCPLNR